MAKDALLPEKFISAECVRYIRKTRELCGLAVCTSSPGCNRLAAWLGGCQWLSVQRQLCACTAATWLAEWPWAVAKYTRVLVVCAAVSGHAWVNRTPAACGGARRSFCGRLSCYNPVVRCAYRKQWCSYRIKTRELPSTKPNIAKKPKQTIIGQWISKC